MRAINPNVFGSILFVGIPEGGAPESIRKEWIGIEVPCLYRDDNDDESLNVVTGDVEPSRASYIVLQVHALELLAKKSPEAVRYWNSIGFPHHEMAAFSFDLECAEVVRPVLTKEEFTRLYESCLDA